METLPINAKLHKTTPEFNEFNVPQGILGRHTTSDGIWGRIVVKEGQLTYRILDPLLEEHILDTSHAGTIAPQRAHQVVINAPVKFYIEFFKQTSK